jgi:hypothetical protein
MKLAKIATAILFTGLAASAFAGPDWDVIQRARAAATHQAAEQQDFKTRCMQMMHQASSPDANAQRMSNAV